MGWFDDLTQRVEQEAKNVYSDVGQFFENQAKDAAVKIGKEQLGNLSQLDLDKGKTGAPPAQAPAPIAQAAISTAKVLPFLIIGGLIYFSMSGGRRRG